MKRRTFRAFVTDGGGERIIGERDTFAWNSAIRATEDIVREYARASFGVAHGAAPVVMDDRASGGERIYRRVWTGPDGRELRALVWEVFS